MNQQTADLIARFPNAFTSETLAEAYLFFTNQEADCQEQIAWLTTILSHRNRISLAGEPLNQRR